MFHQHNRKPDQDRLHICIFSGQMIWHWKTSLCAILWGRLFLQLPACLVNYSSLHRVEASWVFSVHFSLPIAGALIMVMFRQSGWTFCWGQISVLLSCKAQASLAMETWSHVYWIPHLNSCPPHSLIRKLALCWDSLRGCQLWDMLNTFSPQYFCSIFIPSSKKELSYDASLQHRNSSLSESQWFPEDGFNCSSWGSRNLMADLFLVLFMVIQNFEGII